MSYKIKISLTLDPKTGTKDDMTAAVALLPELGLQPGNKLVFDLEFTYQDEAKAIQDRFDAVFINCPDEVDAQIEVKHKRGAGMAWTLQASNTPVQQALNDLQQVAERTGADSVEFLIHRTS